MAALRQVGMSELLDECCWITAEIPPLVICVCMVYVSVGNASQVSDGAAAVLMGRRSMVEALGLPVLGILRAGAVVGVPPDVMGIGPAYAIPAALEKAGVWALLLCEVLHYSELIHLLVKTLHVKF